MAPAGPHADFGPTDEHTPAISQPTGGPVPARIGHYAIKRQIGSGGMGAVYEAVQEQPRRVVALKVLRAGVTGKSALRRFEYESQLLGRLRHPGIAQVYEAGTHETPTGPVPFFAMEYIPGAKTITDFAAAKKLGTRERMELIARVCDAVHHGHQKGIIHRDLKPGNILVDSAGDPKVIDFGVARATDSDMALTTLQTDIGQLIGTLQYMSPEQCAADPHDIDVRSDVYALGVVLYELLCGKMPYDVSRSALAEATRKIREEEPAKLSTLNRTLRGDPETIAFKALEKERERRYRSAADLADDLRRHLKGEPISARPVSVAYQVRVFARRHRVLAGAAAAVLVVTTTAAAVSGRYWYLAVSARDYALMMLGEASRARIAERAALQNEAEARRTAEAEAADARFRESAARSQAIASHHAMQALIPTARSGLDAVNLARGDLADELPRAVIEDTSAWLGGRFPELFGTNVRGAVSDGVGGMMRVYIDQFGDQTDPKTRDAVRRWVRNSEPRLLELERATSGTRFAFHTEFQESDRPLVTGMLLPMGQLRTAAAALVVRASLLGEEGRFDEAFASLRAARRLARDSAGGGLLLGALVEASSRTRISREFRSLSVECGARSVWPRDAAAFIATDAPIPSFQFSIELESPTFRQMIGECFSKGSDQEPTRFDARRAERVFSESGVPHSESDLARCSGTEYEPTVAAYSEIMNIYRSLAAMSPEQRETADTTRLTALREEHPLLMLLAPRDEHAFHLHARAVMDRDATIITAAIAAWRAARGSWPASIDEALAAFPVQPLRRDYYGHDFVYRVENDRPVLYSVGPDGKDDGGLGAWDHNKKDGGDLLYIAPAAP